MTRPWPDAEDLLVLLAAATAPQARVRDGGALYAAAARPHATLVDRRVHPTALQQAAALLHAITAWRPLDMWNESLAWYAADVRLERAGLVLAMPSKERMQLADDLNQGAVDSIEEIVLRLSPYLEMLD